MYCTGQYIHFSGNMPAGNVGRVVLVITAIIATVTIAPPAEAVTAFNCDEEHIKTVPIDLTQPKGCPDPVKDFDPARSEAWRVLQTDTDVPVEAYQCIITVTKEVHRCGFDSVHYGSIRTVVDEPQPVLPEECRLAARNRAITYEGKIRHVDLGIVHHFSQYTHGSRDKNGVCKHSNFRSGETNFVKSYEETFLTIQIKIVRGTADLSTGNVLFTNGLRANFADGVMKDQTEGTIVWTATPPSCSKSTSLVYNGQVKIHRKRAEGDLGAIVMIANGTSGQYAGFVIRESQTVCRIKCYTTQVDGLVLCPAYAGTAAATKLQYLPHIDTRRTAAQSQMGHLHLTENMKVYKRFDAVTKDLCILDKRVLHTKLHALAGTHNPYALLDIMGAGHTVYTAGAVAYVAQCLQVEGHRVDHPNCTEEVPMLINGTVMFADPLTWILKSFPTVIPCSDLMPVRWKISGVWWCARPAATRCDAPKQLNVTTGQETRFSATFTNELGKSLYTTAQREQNKAFRVAQTSRQAVLAKVTNVMTGGGHASGPFSGPILRNQADALIDRVGGTLLPFFDIFGRSIYWITGVLMCLMIIKILIGTLWRLERGYQAHGRTCGFWCLWAWWSTAFQMITFPMEIVKSTLRGVSNAGDTELQRRDSALVTYADCNRRLAQLQHDQQELIIQIERRREHDYYEPKGEAKKRGPIYKPPASLKACFGAGKPADPSGAYGGVPSGASGFQNFDPTGEAAKAAAETDATSGKKTEDEAKEKLIM